MPSNSYDFTIDRDQLVQDAYREIRVLGDGQRLTGNQIERGARALNLLLASIAQKDIRGEFVTVRKRATLFLQKDQTKYSLGTDHCAETFYRTTVGSDIVAGATTINVADTSNMSDGDTVGVLLTSGSWEWQTITIVSSPTQYLIASPGMVGTALAGASVVSYTTLVTAPLDVLTAVLRDTDNFDSPIGLNDTLAAYQARGDKSSAGDPSTAYLERGITTDLYFNTSPSDVTKVVYLVMRYPFSDMDASTDTFDCSKAGLRAIKFALAAELAPQNGKAITKELAVLVTDSMAPFLDENSLTSDDYFQPGAE